MTARPEDVPDREDSRQPPQSASRREFLTGRAARREMEQAAGQLADELPSAAAPQAPEGRETVRLATRAMACDFSVILNPGPGEELPAASEALDLVHVLEDQLTVYRPHSEMSLLNAHAAEAPVVVEAKLFSLLEEAAAISRQTEGAFDPTSGPLIALWRECRQAARLPAQAEIDRCLARTGLEHVQFDAAARTIHYLREGVELNLGGIGKGYALDRAAHLLDDGQVSSWLMHGGHSSLLARGQHTGASGWPVGIRNPLFPDRQLATIVLENQAMASSGSGTQHFRLEGKRYGHILDPRNGWPVEAMLSVAVLAPTAALADALSTAFFVLGLEKARQWCDNREDVAALLIPPPRRGQTLQPVVCGIPEDRLFFAEGVTPAE